MERSEFSVKGLQEVFAGIPDPRSAKGKRHSLPMILAIATVAMLCGAHSIYAIAQWGRAQQPQLLRTLALTRKQSPGVATFHRLFARLDLAAFEKALARWAALNLPAGQQAIAVDGKSLGGQPR